MIKQSIFCLFTLWSIIFIKNIRCETPAQEECRKLHHCDVDPDNTQYLNDNCLLECNIHGKIYQHIVNNGHSCNPGFNNYHCDCGMCVKDRMNNGFIDIHMISASLFEKANAYTSVCLLNSSLPVPLPLQNRTNCFSCSSNVRPNTKFPIWDEICLGTSKYVFGYESRVVLETWNHIKEGENVFLGGSTITIEELINQSLNGKLLHLALLNGKCPGQINVKITWTPKVN